MHQILHSSASYSSSISNRHILLTLVLLLLPIISAQDSDFSFFVTVDVPPSFNGTNVSGIRAGSPLVISWTTDSCAGLDPDNLPRIKSQPRVGCVDIFGQPRNVVSNQGFPNGLTKFQFSSVTSVNTYPINANVSQFISTYRTVVNDTNLPSDYYQILMTAIDRNGAFVSGLSQVFAIKNTDDLPPLNPVQIKTPVGGSMWLSNTSHPVYWTILGFSNKTIYPDRYSLILLSPSNDVVKVISNNSIPYVDSELGFPANRSDWFIQDIPEGRYRLKWVGMFSNNLPVEPPQATSQVFSILPPAAKLNAGVKERPTLMEYWNSPKKQFGSRSTRSSIIFGDDSSPFNAPQVQRTSSNSNLFDKLRSVVPAGVSSAEVSSSQQRPVNRRHTLMGGSGVASILGGSSAEENTPPKPTVSRYRSYSKSSPSPIIPPSEPQPPEPLIKSSKRHSIGIVPHASEEIRPQTKRLMPEHQLGFKPSTNIFSQDAPQEKPLPPTPQKTPPALRSSIVFGGESDSTPPPSRQMTPTSGKTNQSNLLLGDDGGVLNNTIKKKTSVRRMITPPGESGKKLSLADFVGAPPSDEVKPVLHHAKQKIDPASVGVAGKSSGKHRVY